MYILKTSIYIALLFSFVYGGDIDYNGWLQLRLWHSFTDDTEPEFVKRGNITISSLRNENAIPAQLGLSETQLAMLYNLAKSNGKYKLKINVHSSRGSENTFMTNILACQLIGSQLEDSLNIWLDSSGEPVAINLISQAPCSYSKISNNMFMTNVHIKYPDTGPTPDTASYILKLEREKEARERAETKDNRFFFAKYWMYIVPVVFIVILSSATNPEAAGPGGGGGVASRHS